MCERSLGRGGMWKRSSSKIRFQGTFSWIEAVSEPGKEETTECCKTHTTPARTASGTIFSDPPVLVIAVLRRQEMPNVSNAKQKHSGQGPLMQPTSVKHLSTKSDGGNRIGETTVNLGHE